MKSASSSSRTTFVSGVVPKGGTYALHSVSPHRPPAASPRRRLSANRTEAQAVQTGLYSRRAAQRYPLRRRLAAVAGPRLWPLARRPLRRHPARCPRLSVRRPRPTPAPTQPLARGLRPILGPPPRPTPETPRLPRGHRPDPHPLLRSRGLDPLDLPRQGTPGHPPLPRLRHRLCRLARPALHPGPDLRPRQGTPGSRRQTLETTGCQDKASGGLPAARPGLLPGGGLPLFAGRPRAVPDAGDRAGPQAHGDATGGGHAPVPVLQEEWLVHVPSDRPPWQAESHGIDRCAVPQPCGPPGQTWSLRVAVCLLGDESGVAPLGARGLPSALWHRNQLPADERGAGPDQQPQRRAAAVVRGGGAGVAQPVGVVARGSVGRAPGKRPAVAVGVAAAARSEERRVGKGCRS